MESVGSWPLANLTNQTFGGTPKPITVLGRDRWLVTPSWGPHVAAHGSPLAGLIVLPAADRPLGNTVGATGLPAGTPPVLRPGEVLSGEASGSPGPRPLRATRAPSRRGFHPGFRFAGPWAHGSYLVDSASSHMLVSKIKPCMSKYKQSIR